MKKSRRRGQNEGTIHRRNDGRWAGAVSLGWRNGKRLRRQVYGRTRADVVTKLTKLLRDHQQGLPVESSRLTVAQFLEQWLESTHGTVREITHESYSRLVNRHLIPGLGRIKLERLRPDHVQAFMAEKLATGLSPRTVQYLRAILRRALQRAVRWQLVPHNVAALTDPPHVARREFETLTPEEARKLLKTAREDRLGALYGVALALGLRRGEALGLHWADVDLRRKTLRVRYGLLRVGGRLQLVETKSATSRRAIELPEIAVTMLREHGVRQKEERLRAGGRWRDSGLVFTTRHGKPLEPSNVVTRFHRLLKKAGLRHQRIHDLRHTCATLLLIQGVNPKVVMERLGHSSIRLTLDTYSHVTPSLQRDASAKMDDILTDRGK